MAGSWSNTAVSSITVPTGAVSGARIVIDGNSDAILIYDSTGSLIISLSPTGGTDPFGNGYPAGLNLSGGGLINVPAPNPGSVVFTSEVYGDSFARMNFLVDGTMTWGSGSAPADTNFYRAFTGQLQTDGKLGVTGVLKEGTYVVKETAGSDEAWQPASMVAGFTSIGLQYRIDAMDNLVIAGGVRMTAASAGAGAAVITNASPARFHPLNPGRNACAWLTSGSVAKGSAVISANSDGTLSLIWPAATAANDRFDFSVSFPLGNMP